MTDQFVCVSILDHVGAEHGVDVPEALHTHKQGEMSIAEISPTRFVLIVRADHPDAAIDIIEEELAAMYANAEGYVHYEDYSFTVPAATLI